MAGEERKGEVNSRENPYRIRGEVGEYEFKVYDIKNTERVHEFSPQRGKSYRQTVGFKNRYLYDGCTKQSYRQVAKSYEKECFKEVRCSGRSFQDMVVREGEKIGKELERKSIEILGDYGIEVTSNSVEVTPELKKYQFAPRYLVEKAALKLAFDKVRAQSPKYIKDRLELDYEAYENKSQTINISNDDVCAKRQKTKRGALTEEEEEQKKKESQRKGGRKNRKKRKFLYQNTTHFEFLGKQYRLIGNNLSSQLNRIIAFLVYNSGLDKNWVFYVDGQRTINDCIKKRFWWKNIDLILDWYHLNKRLAKQMYYSLHTCDRRDDVQKILRDYLWYGLVDEAIAYLAEIEEDLIKNEVQLDNLKGYFQRNQAHIKCYALRKELGLRLSSNRVEKVNDELVSTRQKSNGMSFTRPGSYGLSILTCTNINEEQLNWMKHQKIRFKFAA